MGTITGGAFGPFGPSTTYIGPSVSGVSSIRRITDTATTSYVTRLGRAYGNKGGVVSPTMPMGVFMSGKREPADTIALSGAGGGGNDDHSYIIKGGKKGSDRLVVLANATWQTSKSFLLRAGLTAGMHCLDVGCGNGEISLRLFEILGDTGSVNGVDLDPTKIAIAREKAAQANNQRSHFTVLNLETDALPVENTFDFIYVRLLLSHLRYPQRVLERLQAHLKPQGILAIEDVDFDGHHCEPECAAFRRYVELYKAAARQRGADATIGSKIEVMTSVAGYKNIQATAITPSFTTGDGKMMALITMEAIREAVVAADLTTQEDFDAVLRELAAFSHNPHTTMSIPTFVQISCGR